MGPFFQSPRLALRGVLQPLVCQLEIAFQLPHLQASLRQVPLDLSTLCLGRGPGLNPLFPLPFIEAEPLAMAGKRFADFLFLLPQRRCLLVELRELTAGQGHDNAETFFGEFLVPLGSPALPRQTPHLCLDFRDQVVETPEIFEGLVESPLRRRLAISVEGDTGRLFEQRAPLVGAVRQEPVDLLRLDHDTTFTPQSGSPQEILNVAQAHRLLIQEVFAQSRAREAPRYHHLSVGDRERRVAVIEVQRDFRDIGRLPLRRALENDVFHAGAAENPSALLAEYPANCVGDVGLPAAVRADNRRNAVLERQFYSVGKRLEARQHEPGQFHRALPVRVIRVAVKPAAVSRDSTTAA